MFKEFIYGLFIPWFLYLAFIICLLCDKIDANDWDTVPGEKPGQGYSPWVVGLSKEQA